MVALAAAGTVAIVRDGGGAAPAVRLAIGPKTLGLIDARSHEVVGQIAFTSQPWDVAFDRRFAWVLLGDERRVARVDLASRTTLSSAKLPFSPGGITTGAGAAWVTEDGGARLVRLTGRTGTISATYSIPIRGDRYASPSGIAFGAGSVWVARGAETVRVDPANGRALSRIPTPLSASWVAFADGAVWVASSENGRVVKIDPATDRITAVTPLHATVTDLAVDSTAAWVAIVPDDIVYRLSPDDGSVLSTAPAGPWPATLSAGDGVWIADAKGRQLIHIDPAGRREQIPTAGIPLMTRFHGGLLWASVRAPEQAPPAVTGEELRIPLVDDAIGNADPAANGGPVFRQLAYSTCATLVSHPDAAGAAGRRLVPEVAAALPAVSHDGRTYTFRIKPGFRFSPPSGQEVTAETFKFTIERAMSRAFAIGRGPSAAAQVLADIAGVPAYTSGRASHVSGITVHGDTLTFTLTRAAGDFAERLTSSSICPVPVGTPALDGGGTQTPIAMTGPYYVVSASEGRTVLERNPNYRGDRPRRIARIVYSTGATSAEIVSRVRSGRADYLNLYTAGDEAAAALAPGGSLDRAFGLASRAGRAGGARYVPSPAPGFDAVAFNTTRPLFRKQRLRRAVAYALDRTALAGVFGELPSDRILPPAVGGAGGTLVYPTEPDLAAARRLAGHGRRRRATLYYCGDPINGRIAQIVRSNLARIGIAVRIDASLGCLTGPQTKRLAAADMQLVSRFEPFSDPAAFVDLAVGDPYTVPAYPIGAPIVKEVRSARSLLGAARAAAYARLEATLVRNAAPVAVYASGVNPEFFSARVGCKLSQGALNVADLGALCLRG
jgi:ABC-type transport system substrate-binding protein